MCSVASTPCVSCIFCPEAPAAANPSCKVCFGKQRASVSAQINAVRRWKKDPTSGTGPRWQWTTVAGVRPPDWDRKYWEMLEGRLPDEEKWLSNFGSSQTRYYDYDPNGGPAAAVQPSASALESVGEAPEEDI